MSSPLKKTRLCSTSVIKLSRIQSSQDRIDLLENRLDKESVRLYTSARLIDYCREVIKSEKQELERGCKAQPRVGP